MDSPDYLVFPGLEIPDFQGSVVFLVSVEAQGFPESPDFLGLVDSLGTAEFPATPESVDFQG